MNNHVWSSKWVFILASIGAAAGLGNIWKFPFLVYDHGGGAFIIAYLVMLFAVGLTILISEISLGQMYSSAGPNAFGSISKRLRWLGWCFALGCFTILSYYIVVIGWGVDYLYYSLQSLGGSSLPWAGNGSGFFFENILGISDGASEKGSLSMPVLYGTLVTLGLLYFFTRNSARSVSKVIMITATLPFLTLLILAIRGVTLPGAELGLNYILSFDAEQLWNVTTWTAAAGQIFFTLSISMGAMIVYGAFKKPDSEIAKSVTLVALGNTLISFLSAFAIFGTLGFLASQKGVPITEVAQGGPSLAFVVMPETLAQFSSLSVIFSIIFFATIFMLAIDSAMSLLEGVTYPLKQRFPHLTNRNITLAVISVLGIVSTRYMYGNGLYMLDIIDYYIQNFYMLFLGVIEICVFIYAGKKFRDFIISRSDILKNHSYYLLTWVIGLITVGGLLIASVREGFTNYDSYTPAELLYYGLYPIIAFVIVAIAINIIENKKIQK